MSKFKFGDKVWHKEYGLCVITGSSPLNAHSIAHNHYARAQLPWFIDEDDLTPATDWVKCNERMPEFNIRVLVHDGQSTYVDFIVEEWDGYGKVFFHSINRATHWQPLPTPPQD